MKAAQFEPRKRTEKDESKKQIIPYVVIRRNGKILAYLRSKKSGEARLHDKWSIGIGGHINPKDAKLGIGPHVTLSCAIERELTEELEWGDLENYTVTGLEVFGVLYDDSDSVGRVHIGLVYTVDLPPDDESVYPFPRENTIAGYKWLGLTELKAANLEGWSSMIVEAMRKSDASSVKHE